MSGPAGNCPPTDEGQEKSLRKAEPAEPDAEGTAMLRPLRSETLHASASAADEASLTDAGPGHGDLQPSFLAPSDKPGSLGRFGHYEVLSRIGEGGMGLVLKARDERLDRIVALKFLKPALAGSALARRRFTREAQTAAAVCHENVVTIHAVDETSGQPYLVMQYVSGHSLQEKIDSKKPLGLEEIVRIGKEVAAGLAAAHARGLVHRDIKPANILLEYDAERVKITDFGLARAIDDASVTQSGVVIGTPSYMSPEQASGKFVDHRTDLFSLGSVLYAMCTGRSPFQADSTVGTLRKVSDEEPQPIRELNPQIPEWLVAIISRLMAKTPTLRYQSAVEVADLLARHSHDLERSSDNQTSSPSELARSRWSKRRLGAAAFGGAMLLSLGPFVWWTLHSRSPVPPSEEGLDRASHENESGSSAPPSPASPFPPPEPRPALEAEPTLAKKPDLETSRKAQDLAAAGTLSLRNGEFHKAIDQFTEAIRIDSSNPRHWLARAHAQCRNEIANWPAAIADANQVLRLDPQNAGALEARAYAECRSRDFRRAIEDATEALRIDPRLVEAYVHRGTAYMGLAEWNHALVDLNEYLKRAPERPWGWHHRSFTHMSLGDLEPALAASNRSIALEPNVHHFRFLRAQIQTARRDYDRAAADYAEAIRVSPESEKIVGYGMRGGFESSLSRLDPAIADYTEAIRRLGNATGPETAWYYAGRGKAYLAHDEVDKAIADFGETIRRDPKSTFVRLCRGVAWLRKQEWERALADFDAELQLGNSLRASCLQHRAEVQALAGRYEEAEATYKEVSKNAGRFIRVVLASQAWCVDRPHGDYAAALKKLDQAVVDDWPVASFFYRGLLHARTGQPDRALADFNHLMKLFETTRPDMFAIEDFFSRRLAFLLGRGEAYLLNGDLDRALADSDEAVRFAPTSAEARILRARVHEKKGLASLAVADRRTAMRLTPDPMLAFPPPRSSDTSKSR